MTETLEDRTVNCGGCDRPLTKGTTEYKGAVVRLNEEGESFLFCLRCQVEERFHVEPPEFMKEMDGMFEDSMWGTTKGMYRMIDREVRDVYGISYGKIILSSALSAAFWGGLGYLMGKRK